MASGGAGEGPEGLPAQGHRLVPPGRHHEAIISIGGGAVRVEEPLLGRQGVAGATGEGRRGAPVGGWWRGRCPRRRPARPARSGRDRGGSRPCAPIRNWLGLQSPWTRPERRRLDGRAGGDEGGGDRPELRPRRRAPPVRWPRPVDRSGPARRRSSARGRSPAALGAGRPARRPRWRRPTARRGAAARRAACPSPPLVDDHRHIGQERDRGSQREVLPGLRPTGRGGRPRRRRPPPWSHGGRSWRTGPPHPRPPARPGPALHPQGGPLGRPVANEADAVGSAGRSRGPSPRRGPSHSGSMAAASPPSDGSSGKRKARVSGATTTPRPSDGSSPSSESRTVISSDPSWWSTVQEAPGSYLASSTWLLAGARPRRSARSGPIRPPRSTRSTRVLLVTRHRRGAHHGGHVRPAVAKRSVRRLAAASRSKSASTVRRAAAPSRSRRAVSASSSPMASAMAPDVVGRGEQAVVAVAHEVLDPAHRRRHHRQPAGHRLGQHVGHAVAIAVGRDARGQGEHLGARRARAATSS